MKFFILPLVFYSSFSFGLQDSIHKCSPSTSPLFREGYASNVINLEVVADIKAIHRIINNEGTESPNNKFSAVISYTEGNQKIKIPAIVKGKGGVRTTCQFPPLEFHFQKDNTTAPGQSSNLFTGLGDKARLVTHCGKSNIPQLGHRTRKGQEEKLLFEFYLYQVLDTLKSTTLKTRLVKTTYIDPKGQVLDTVYSFFRETKKNVAKRCGLKTEAAPTETIPHKNSLSETQLILLENLVANSDYATDATTTSPGGTKTSDDHNVYTFYNQKGEKIFAPYDFDLSSIISNDFDDRSYLPNSLVTEEEIKVANYILARSPEMLKIINQSLMSPSLKSKVSAHITNTMTRYQTLLKNK